MYKLLPVHWSRSEMVAQSSHVQFVAVALLLLRYTICFRCFVEVLPQSQDVRAVAVALVSKRCPNVKMYDSMLRYTISCRCYRGFGLEMVRQC